MTSGQEREPYPCVPGKRHQSFWKVGQIRSCACNAAAASGNSHHPTALAGGGRERLCGRGGFQGWETWPWAVGLSSFSVTTAVTSNGRSPPSFLPPFQALHDQMITAVQEISNLIDPVAGAARAEASQLGHKVGAKGWVPECLAQEKPNGQARSS